MPPPNSNESRPPLSWFVPSITHWIWLSLFFVLVMEPCRTKLVSSDSDACMHWRLGETMLQTRHILRVDTFSHTRNGDRFITKEWLAEIAYALAGRLRGFAGLSILAALVIASTFALLHRQLLRNGADILVATFLLLVALWASVPHWHARPHIFSLLLLLWWNDALRQHEQGGSSRKLAAILGALTLVWVNTHGAYLAGFLVLGSYWLGSGIELLRSSEPERRAHARGRFIALTWVGVLCGIVSFANPNGYLLHLHNLSFVRSEFFVNRLDEYSAANFHLAKCRGLLAWLAILTFAFAVCRPKVSASAVILVISWTYYALYAERNISLLVILTAPIVSAILTDYVRSGRFTKWTDISERMARIHRSSRGWPLVAAVATGIVFLFPLPVHIPPARWPVQAVKYIKEHPEKFEGRLFNDPLWGGYLLLVLPEHKVFADGRVDFYREKVIQDLDAVTEVSPDWKRVLDAYQISWTLLPQKSPLHQVLALSPEWYNEYSDGTATIYRRKQQ